VVIGSIPKELPRKVWKKLKEQRINKRIKREEVKWKKEKGILSSFGCGFCLGTWKPT